MLARAALVFGAWTAVGLFSISQAFLYSITAGAPRPESLWIARDLESVWLWAALTPAILALEARFPIERARWPSRVAFHAAASLAFAFADVLVDAAFAPLLGPRPAPSVGTAFFRQSFLNVSSYWVVLLVGQAARDRGLLVEKRLRASELEAQLAETRLRALEMQLRPHFLFNALHAVAALVRAGENRAAVKVIAQLGDLLRTVLRGDGEQEVPLRDELLFVERYLAIEQARFGERLTARVDAAPALGDALVPRFVLQPLVENAVRHGVEPRPEAGRVEVRAARSDGVLRLEVRDTGGGPERAAPRDGGVGLANTRARLRHLYGERQRLELAAAPGGGTIAVVEIPFHEGRAEARHAS